MANAKKRGRPKGRHQEEGKIKVCYRLFPADNAYIKDLSQEIKRRHPYGGSESAAIHELIAFYQQHHSKPLVAAVIDGNRRLAATASPPPA